MRCGWGNAHFVLRAIRTACLGQCAALRAIRTACLGQYGFALGQYDFALGQYALRAQDNTHCVLRAIRLCPREMGLRLRITERF